MTAKDIVRMGILNDIVSRMSDEDRRNYILLTDSNEMKKTLAIHDAKLDEIIRRSSWTKSFASDVGANVLTNAVFLLLAKLLK
jgi:hypothetical protein